MSSTSTPARPLPRLVEHSPGDVHAGHLKAAHRQGSGVPSGTAAQIQDADLRGSSGGAPARRAQANIIDQKCYLLLGPGREGLLVVAGSVVIEEGFPDVGAHAATISWALAPGRVSVQNAGRMKMRPRLFYWLVPLVVVLAVLLWPLSSREWAIDFDDEAIRAKEAFLARERRRAGESGRRAPSDGRPNVVLILADDLAQQDLGIYGHPVVETPHIDSLGRDGVVFTQATATTSICAPSRAALLTGRHQQRFGFEYQPHTRYPRNRLEYLVFRHLIDTSPMVPAPPMPTPRRRDIRNQGLPPSEVTIAEVLQARGYRTSAIGKWHLGYNHERFSPLELGFEEHYGFYEAFSLYAPIDDPEVVNVRIDDFSDKHMWSVGRTGAAAIVHNDEVVTEEDYLTDVFADRAVRFIREAAEAGTTPRGDAGATGAAGATGHAAADGAGRSDRAERDPFFLYVPFSAPHTPLQATREYWDRYAHVENEVHRAYYAMITSLDDAVGRILTALEETGVAEDTLVIFASDNGGVNYMGISDNGSLAAGKFSTFRGGLVVPMIMRFPGRIPEGARFDHPVSLLDVMPTVAAVTGGPAATGGPAVSPGDAAEGSGAVELPAPVDGVNLLPYLDPPGGAGARGAGAAPGAADNAPAGDAPAGATGGGVRRAGGQGATGGGVRRAGGQGATGEVTRRTGNGALGAPHETLYWRSGYNLAVRRGDWKLYRDRRNDITRLYDLGSDPGETTDLSAAHPEKVAELEDALAVWEAGLAPKAWPRVMDVFMDIHGVRYWFGI